MVSKNKVVLGFDSWTGGSRHFNRLVKSFNHRGIQFKLIHLGSWGVDPERPCEEIIEDLKVVDISFFGRSSFVNILEQENPVAVLFLSTDTFAHRAFIRSCAKIKVPTIHVYHGLMNALAVDVGKPYDRNAFSQAKFVTSRILKMVSKVWPTYAWSLIITRASLSDWLRFIRDNWDLMIGKVRLNSASDAKTDLCCVYTDADVSHASNRYGYELGDIIAVGNPDLRQFGIAESAFGICLKQDLTENPFVMYIDTALALRGSSFANIEEFFVHLEDVSNAVKLLGKSLVVKLHPDHFRTDTPDHFAQKGIFVCPNDSFQNYLLKSAAVIIEPSSAAIVPALLGLPLLLAMFGKLEKQLYGKILTQYPRSKELKDLADLSTVLEKERDCLNVGEVELWIRENAGPLPVGKMSERIVDQVIKLTERYSKKIRKD